MKILHKLDPVLFELFPKGRNSGSDLQALKEELEEYYTYGPYRPKIKIENGWVEIEIDVPAISNEEGDYKKAVQLCEKQKFDEAKVILNELIKRNPSNSEYHRVLGQLYSMQNDQEEAVNSLIDALKWNPKNSWALLMMGNIFAKYKDDVPTAMKYYDKALESNPNDSITINNIGANLMMQGKIEEAKKYFMNALAINPDYPNTHYALSLIAESENDLQSSFYSATQALKKSTSKDELYNNSVQQAIKISRLIITTSTGTKLYSEFKHKLEIECDKKIEINDDPSIPFAAKIEFAENHNREIHVIKYKSSYPAIEHLIMHELMHLQFVLDARRNKNNQLFTTNKSHKEIFVKKLTAAISKLKRKGIEESSIEKYIDSLFEGLNSQIFNTPIDTFIEDFLYNEFPELRPYQFLSLIRIVSEGKDAVTNKSVIEITPPEILYSNKVLNLVNSLLLKDLYGVNIIDDFKATPKEKSQAEAFFEEFNEYRFDKTPGEEYELILHWAEDLKIQGYFELVDEISYREKRLDPENLLRSIEEDPFDVNTNDINRIKEMETFQKSQATIGTNMAVVMFMVEALQYFSSMNKEAIKKIAFEIALVGTQGIAPDKENYRISLIPNKKFTGYHLLAYYYVSWKLAIPEMLEQLKLPYDEEYILARQLSNNKK